MASNNLEIGSGPPYVAGLRLIYILRPIFAGWCVGGPADAVVYHTRVPLLLRSEGSGMAQSITATIRGRIGGEKQTRPHYYFNDHVC